MTQQENHANADKLSIQKIIFFVNDSVSIRQEATFCVERWRERNVFCTERESFGFSGKCFTGRRCSLLTDKREPERTAVPAGHESPSGAFKPQTGLRSKCRVFSAARSQRFRCAGPDGLRHPASASCLGRHSHPAGRCPNSSSLHPPLAAVVAVALFSRFSDLKAPQPLRRQLPAGERVPRWRECSRREPAAADAVCRYDSSREKTKKKSPQAFLFCKLKIIFPL